jgi:hypothetical protein
MGNRNTFPVKDQRHTVASPVAESLVNRRYSRRHFTPHGIAAGSVAEAGWFRRRDCRFQLQRQRLRQT